MGFPPETASFVPSEVLVYLLIASAMVSAEPGLWAPKFLKSHLLLVTQPSLTPQNQHCIWKSHIPAGILTASVAKGQITLE